MNENKEQYNSLEDFNHTVKSREQIELHMTKERYRQKNCRISYDTKKLYMFPSFNDSFIKKCHRSLDVGYITYDKVEEIYLDGDYNQKFSSEIFPNLRLLFIKGEFNQPIYDLPEKIETLIISGKFNQPIDYLPSGLKSLILIGSFNQPLFDYSIDKKIVELLKSNKCKKRCILPESLCELLIENKNYNLEFNPDKLFKHLPNLEKITFNNQKYNKKSYYKAKDILEKLNIECNLFDK